MKEKCLKLNNFLHREPNNRESFIYGVGAGIILAMFALECICMYSLWF